MANCLEHAVQATTSTGSSTARPTACSCSRRSSTCWASRSLPVLPPWGTALAAPCCAAPACRSSPRCCSQLRFGRALDNRRSRRPASATSYTTRETVLKLREHQRLAPILRGAAGRATATRRRSRSSCASARACASPTSRPRQLPPANSAPRARRRAGAARAPSSATPPASTAYGSLPAREILAILPSLATRTCARCARTRPPTPRARPSCGASTACSARRLRPHADSESPARSASNRPAPALAGVLRRRRSHYSGRGLLPARFPSRIARTSRHRRRRPAGGPRRHRRGDRRLRPRRARTRSPRASRSAGSTSAASSATPPRPSSTASTSTPLKRPITVTTAAARLAS